MRHTIFIGTKPIILEHDDFDDVIDVDSLTKIDTSNLFGEATTISVIVNRIGLIKSAVEGQVADYKLDLRVFESNFIRNLRKESSKASGICTIRVDNEDVKVKATEKFLESCFESDQDWINIKKALNKAEKNFNSISSLYWAIQDKSRRLNGLVSSTTPEQFVAGIISGKINGILITK
jgi:hypothetical protein